MKKTIFTVSALALALSLGAQANTSGDVQVSGTISPTPCTITATNNTIVIPTFFYTDIEPGLTGWDQVIPNAVSFSISCSNETDIGIMANTNQDGFDIRANPNFADMPFDGFFSNTYGLRRFANRFNESAAWFSLIRSDRQVMQTFESSDAGVTSTCGSAADNYGLPNFTETSGQPNELRGWCDTVVQIQTYDLDLQVVYEKNSLFATRTTDLTSTIELEIYYR